VPRSVSHRCRVVVPSDRVLDQLDDGLALVSEHRVDGLDGDAGFLGDKVPNWDGKGAGDRFFAATGVPTTYLLTPRSIGRRSSSGSGRRNRAQTVCHPH
jgi:hypothetical protein